MRWEEVSLTDLRRSLTAQRRAPQPTPSFSETRPGGADSTRLALFSRLPFLGGWGPQDGWREWVQICVCHEGDKAVTVPGLPAPFTSLLL